MDVNFSPLSCATERERDYRDAGFPGRFFYSLLFRLLSHCRRAGSGGRCGASTMYFHVDKSE